MTISSSSATDAAARNYSAAHQAIEGALARAPHSDRAARMRIVVDALWEALSSAGVSWVGFYLHDPDNALSLGATADAPLVLGPHRDKPACSPIGLAGVCGQAFTSGQTRIVRDVRELGEDYIACDPRDRSEIVIPLFACGANGARSCWGVFDVDSHAVGAFDKRDEAGLKAALAAAGLLDAPPGA